VPSLDEVDARLKRIEQLLDRAIAKAQTTPVGRKILTMLGLE
jgi:hypothetical protein